MKLKDFNDAHVLKVTGKVKYSSSLKCKVTKVKSVLVCFCDKCESENESFKQL